MPVMDTSIQTVADYLTPLPPGQRAVLERVRAIILETVPDATESISYGMPTYTYNGKRLIYFAAYKNHMSLFGAIGALEAKLTGFKLSHRGTVQFTEAHPLPDELVKEIVCERLARIS